MRPGAVGVERARRYVGRTVSRPIEAPPAEHYQSLALRIVTSVLSHRENARPIPFETSPALTRAPPAAMGRPLRAITRPLRRTIAISRRTTRMSARDKRPAREGTSPTRTDAFEKISLISFGSPAIETFLQ